MKKIIVLPASVILFFPVIMFFLIVNGFILPANPSKVKYPVRGIDISHHNGDIDWNSIDKTKTDFIIIKATEGDDLIDHMFAANWKNADEKKIARGAYHFYSLRIKGKEQAENFIRVVPLEPGILPPFVDLEFGGNSRQRPAKKDFLNELKTFLELLEVRYRKKPVLYATYEFYDRYLSGELPGHDIWIRSVLYEPGNLNDGRKWLFWQFTGRGHVKGIKGFTDRNVFNGDERMFKELLE